MVSTGIVYLQDTVGHQRKNPFTKRCHLLAPIPPSGILVRATLDLLPASAHSYKYGWYQMSSVSEHSLVEPAGGIAM